MPEPQEYIEPPGRGFVHPPSASDAFGLAPMPATPLPSIQRDERGDLLQDGQPPDTLIPDPRGSGFKVPAWEVKPMSAPESAPDIRGDTVKFWMAQGAPEHVAQGIADRVNVESGFNPSILGDAGTSGGLYQHHADRLEKLKAFAAKHGERWDDYRVQNAYSALEVKAGLDPIASAHWQEILAAPDRATANKLWTKYFERPMQGWATNVSPALQERANALDAEANQLRDRYHADANELMRQANSAPPGSRERDDAIAKLREREHEYMQKYEDISSNPPIKKPVDALANFGSAATIVALIGGLFARRHMTAAIGAAGQAMQAINQNNHEEFQREYKTWEQQTTTALNMVKLHNEEIRSLIDDKKMAWDEKNSRLRLLFEGLGMQRLADQMALGAHEKVFQEVAGLERASQSAAQSKLAFQTSVAAQLEAKYLADGLPPEQARARAAREAGIIPSGGAATQSKGREQEIAAEVERRDAEWLKNNQNATAEEKQKQHFENRKLVEQEMALATARSATGTLSDDQAKFLADQYILGNYSVITQLPRSGDARIKVENEIGKKIKEMPDAAQTVVMNQLRMKEAESAARTAGRVTMQTELYAQEAVLAGNEVVARSDEVPRTEMPTVNRAIEAFYRGTGDPKIIRFGAALNALVNAYGKMSNPTGTGIHDADKERFTKIMDTALAKGQIREGVDQIMREGRIISVAAEQAQREVLQRIAPGSQVPLQTVPSPQLAPAPLPSGVPEGSKKLDRTYNGKDVYEAPDGKRYVVE